MLACDNLRNNVELGNFAAGRHISRMPKRKRETEWEVIRLKTTPAAFVGLVHAPDAETAIKQFNIRREDQSRLPIRPR